MGSPRPLRPALLCPDLVPTRERQLQALSSRQSCLSEPSPAGTSLSSPCPSHPAHCRQLVPVTVGCCGRRGLSVSVSCIASLQGKWEGETHMDLGGQTQASNLHLSQ